MIYSNLHNKDKILYRFRNSIIKKKKKNEIFKQTLQNVLSSDSVVLLLGKYPKEITNACPCDIGSRFRIPAVLNRKNLETMQLNIVSLRMLQYVHT